MSKEKEQKKKSTGKGVAAAGGAAVVLAALALLNKMGFGPDLGLGKISDEKPAPTNAQVQEITTAAEEEAATEEATEAETTEAVPVYADIKVSGSTYMYDGSESDTDALIEAVKKLDGDVIVRITDDSATQNAMEELKQALDKNDIAYIINE